MSARLRRSVWAPPILIGMLTALGLLLALLGDGLWDWLSMTGLAVPVIVAIRFGLKRPEKKN